MQLDPNAAETLFLHPDLIAPGGTKTHCKKITTYFNFSSSHEKVNSSKESQCEPCGIVCVNDPQKQSDQGASIMSVTGLDKCGAHSKPENWTGRRERTPIQVEFLAGFHSNKHICLWHRVSLEAAKVTDKIKNDRIPQIQYVHMSRPNQGKWG